MPAPVGSETGFTRPVLVVQCNAFNRSRIGTVVVVPLTRNLRLADTPGNVRLSIADTGLPSESVANVSQIVALDRAVLRDLAGQLPDRQLALVLTGIALVLGREPVR